MSVLAKTDDSLKYRGPVLMGTDEGLIVFLWYSLNFALSGDAIPLHLMGRLYTHFTYLSTK